MRKQGHEKIKGIFMGHKICLRGFYGSCNGTDTNGDWGRPLGTRYSFSLCMVGGNRLGFRPCAKGRPMLENNTRIAKDAAIVDEAITSRRSVRAFLPDMVDDETIRAILAVAARAPSGTNMQPWRVYVTKGEVKQRISDAILNSGIRAEKAEWDEYRYYPDQFFEPYLTRRRANADANLTELAKNRELLKATPASTALPPCLSAFRPACVASG